MSCGMLFRSLEDGHCRSCNTHESKTTLRRMLVAAKTHADRCIRFLAAPPKHWTESWGWTDEQIADHAAEAARQTYRLCLRYQLAGGHPADGGEAL